MARLQAILFDKDGTLTDFRASWIVKYRGAARELAARAGGGAALARELLLLVGYDAASGDFDPDSPLLWAASETIARLWCAHPALRRLEGVEAVVERHFTDEVRYPPVPVGDLRGLFLRLRARGCLLGIATMDRAAGARAIAERLGFAHCLSFIAGADSGVGHKPGPGMVEAFCRSCGIEPGAIAVVGDSTADLEMARSAGCRLGIAVTTGATPKARLEPLADLVLSSVLDLETAIFDTHAPDR